ncbi:hypothetical protein SD427_18870 (plasmid) [Chryseobacterium sp. JJR-5R]|uniref:hypothetical protein n=1 Tax=Chryseobacterium sp. JJR-5R TaxID=3093923 RepID=UPI002A747833|nr:hypothetical protein [Chryseobacterium sp. JJR-5R]WPO84592.1 hypothetical protein SD427_18870 [Chryseobacterium sp. JJR-5R]
MYDYKALLITIADCEHEKICSTPEEAQVFLEHCNIMVTESSIKHLKRIFSIINYNHINQDGEPNHIFSDNGDPKNPEILIYNYTGNYSRLDFSPAKIQNVCDKIEAKYRAIEKDFKIDMQLKLIEGGFQWQWSDQQEKYFAVHNFAIRPCYYGNLDQLEAAVDHAADRLINRRSR